MTEGRENDNLEAPKKSSEAQSENGQPENTQPDGADNLEAGTDVQAASFAQFRESGPTGGGTNPQNISLLMDVEMNVRVEVGQTKRRIKEILELTPGSILELDKMAGEPIDVYVNNRLMAVGEVVVVDEKFGIRIMEILDPAERIKRLG